MIQWIIKGELLPQGTMVENSATHSEAHTEFQSFSTDAGDKSSSTLSTVYSSIHAENGNAEDFGIHGSGHAASSDDNSIATVLSVSASLANNSDGVGGYHESGYTSGVTSSHGLTISNTSHSIDAFGETFYTSSTLTFEVTEIFSSEFGHTATFNGATSGHIVVPSVSIFTETGSASGSTTASETFSTSISLAFGTFNYWETSQLSETTFGIQSYTDSTHQGTRWTTTTHSSEGTSMDELGNSNTFESTYNTITTESYSQSDWFGLIDGTGTSETIIVNAVDPFEPGFQDWTVFAADPCHQLYTAGPMDGVEAFCDAFILVDQATLKPAFDVTDGSTNSTGSDRETGSTTFSESADSFSGFGSTSDEFQEGFTNGATETIIVDSVYVDQDMPQTTFGLAGVIMKGFLAGWQAATAMDRTDNIYSTYSIDVATSVTEPGEILARKLGQTFKRNFDSQVWPINSDDTLQMLSLLTGSHSSNSFASKGGYGGIAQGVMSATFSPGVYDVTMYDSDGASTTEKFVFAADDTMTLPEGEMWIISHGSLFSGAGDWNDGFNQVFLWEVAC